MKKIFALLVVLAMVTACGSAMAVTVEGGKEGTDWEFGLDGKILDIKEEGTYTVSNWEGEWISLSVVQKGTVNLTLNNVHLSGDYRGFGIIWYVGSKSDTTGDARLNLTMNDSSINCQNEAFYVHTPSAANKKLNLYVNVTGSNAEINSTDKSAIEMDMKQRSGAMELTLGGTMTLKGGQGAIKLNARDSEKICIDGTPTNGIHAEVSENANGSSPQQLEGSPFSGMSDDVYGEINGKYFLRLYKPEAPAAPADLPKTGDNSRLALWLCLLAFAGAGMTAMRKRAA